MSEGKLTFNSDELTEEEMGKFLDILVKGLEEMESIQRHTDSVMSIMPHVQRMNRKASFRDTAGALTHLTVHSR